MADFSDSSTPIDLHIPEYTENSVEITTPYLDDYDHGDPEPILIKGSWEAILQEAQQLASRQDDEAIPLFDKLVRRIGKMSVAQRVANDERLQKIFTVAAINAQSYLTLRGHYDDALATLETLREIGGAHDKAFADNQRILILFMAGRIDDGFTELRARVQDDEADISDWGQLVMSTLRYGRVDEATAVLVDAQAWTKEQADLELIDQEELREWRGYLATLHADVAMRRGKWEETLQHFEDALAADPMYAKNLHLFYTTLMQAGKSELALLYIARDGAHPIRANFWQGVAMKRMGKGEEAEAAWQRVLDVDLQKSEEPSFSEYVLTHYYLGDEERIGLGNILRVLQEDRRYEWQTLFLAGLGWAIQGRMDNAKTNLQFAVNQRKAVPQGKALPYQTWTYLLDLLPANHQDALRTYFETVWQ
ncbi:MAG: hypothetical protein KDE31_33690 [Caldilineaceae bacterium]|nr:hypothetical protein [Caldilineaceae bacterium]